MRKRVIASVSDAAPSLDQDWLNIEGLVEVEITSEEPEHPIEHALLPGDASGWRAREAGKQTVRLIFDQPQRLTRIWLHFEDHHTERTQEYLLRWSSDGGQTFHDIVRQQWNFSPQGATCEDEDLRVDLPAVTVLELGITPDISDKTAFASLAWLRLA